MDLDAFDATLVDVALSKLREAKPDEAPDLLDAIRRLRMDLLEGYFDFDGDGDGDGEPVPVPEEETECVVLQMVANR